jgi:CRP-like cAMP-binding protein
VYFPISGMISTLAVSADGAEVEAVAVGREGIAGLPLVGQSDTSLFRVSVTLESKAFRMSFEHLTDLAGANDAIAARLDEYRLMTAAQVGRTLVCNSLHRIPQRSSRWLLAASQRTGRSVLPVTQDRISQLLGVRRPTVTDAIQGFVAKGFLEVVRGRIAIRNRAGLEEAACACLADELAQVTRSD